MRIQPFLSRPALGKPGARVLLALHSRRRPVGHSRQGRTSRCTSHGEGSLARICSHCRAAMHCRAAKHARAAWGKGSCKGR
jgi:hypothetical protein